MPLKTTSVKRKANLTRRQEVLKKYYCMYLSKIHQDMDQTLLHHV